MSIIDPPMPLALTLQSGDRRRIEVADGQRLIVGRAPDCDVRLDDQSVSRQHCALERTGEALMVTDLDSVNGTFVNECAVTTARLASGDTFRVGELRFACRGARDVSSGRHRATLGGDDSTIEAVVSRTIVPGQLGWLERADTETARTLLERAERHLTTLHAVADMLARARDVPSLAEATVEAVLDVTGADRGALLTRRGDGVEVDMAAALAPGGADEDFTVSRTLVTDVIATGVSIFAHDASADARFREGASVIAQRVRSVMCVPLRTTDAILGALYVDSLSGPGRFTDADLELVAAVGNQAGIALHRVRLMGDLERLFLDTVRAIAATVDAKDGYTHRHSERVGAFARRIGAALGLSADEQQAAELSALLHDVGKIAVPDSILNKPGRLDSGEFDAIRQHPALGAKILSNIRSPAAAEVVLGVKYHHERWDGKGYPEGLAGEAIPRLGRLLCVADFLDALTSSRSYREPLSMDEAVRLVEEGAGTHFDPRIVEVVTALHARGELAIDADAS